MDTARIHYTSTEFILQYNDDTSENSIPELWLECSAVRLSLSFTGACQSGPMLAL